MGLNESLLNVPERLRIWQQAGIRYFYLDAQPMAAAEDPPHAASEEPFAPPPLPEVGIDPASWPAPWPAIFTKAPANPRLVITYPELGLDMTGRADPRRGALWRGLIQAIGLTGANAVAFWPFCLPDANDFQRDAAIFLAGLRLLQPRVLAFFGEPDPEATTTWIQAVPGLSLVVLAAPHLLYGGDTEAFHHAVTALGGR